MTAMEIRAALLSKGILLIDIAKKCNASKSMEIWEVKAS